MKRVRGFTLLELMVVVAVIAILASIALTSYNKQVRKSRRAEARQMLAEVGLRQEKWRSNNVNFIGTDSDPTTELTPFRPLPTGVYYTVAITTAESGTAYTLTATPKGDQLKDKCGTLNWAYSAGSITKTATGSTPAECW